MIYRFNSGLISSLDRIKASISLLVIQSYRMNKYVITVWETTLNKTEYKLKMSLKLSDHGYCHISNS